MKLFYSILPLLCCIALQAQNSTNEIVKQQLVKDWERAKVYTREYLNAMPADKYSFRPVDSVRSFAEQMLHFAHSNAGMAFIGTGYSNGSVQVFFSPNFGKSPTAQTKDSVLYYVMTSYDFVITALNNFDFSKLSDTVSFDLPGGKRSATRLAWLLKDFEHQTHHRGQCTVYLRLAGIRPPAERLWDQ